MLIFALCYMWSAVGAQREKVLIIYPPPRLQPVYTQSEKDVQNDTIPDPLSRVVFKYN